MKDSSVPESETERKLVDEMLDTIEKILYILDDISDMIDMRIMLTRQLLLEVNRLNHLIDENEGAPKSVEQPLLLITERLEALSRK